METQSTLSTVPAIYPTESNAKHKEGVNGGSRGEPSTLTPAEINAVLDGIIPILAQIGGRMLQQRGLEG